MSEFKCVVEGERWNDFVIHNISCSDVEHIHFVEEGEDVFYVTCYGEDGLEFHNYEPQSAPFWRCLVPVTDTSLLMQSLPQDFLRYLDGPTPTDSVVVSTNTTEYNVKVASDYLCGRYVHSFLYGGWVTLVRDLNMKAGQWMVFTQVDPGQESNVMLFEPDGGAITTVETYSTNIAMNALCHQPHDHGIFSFIIFNYIKYMITL